MRISYSLFRAHNKLQIWEQIVTLQQILLSLWRWAQVSSSWYTTSIQQKLYLLYIQYSISMLDNYPSSHGHK